jgi:hypothetical protein
MKKWSILFSEYLLQDKKGIPDEIKDVLQCLIQVEYQSNFLLIQ